MFTQSFKTAVNADYYKYFFFWHWCMTPLRKKWAWHTHKYCSKNCSDTACSRGVLYHQFCWRLANALLTFKDLPMPYCQCLGSFQGKTETRKRNRLCLRSGEEPGENFRGWINEAWLAKLGKEVGGDNQVQGEVCDPLGLGALLNTGTQSHLCETKPCAFVPNNVVFYINSAA